MELSLWCHIKDSHDLHRELLCQDGLKDKPKALGGKTPVHLQMGYNVQDLNPDSLVIIEYPKALIVNWRNVRPIY